MDDQRYGEMQCNVEVESSPAEPLGCSSLQPSVHELARKTNYIKSTNPRIIFSCMQPHPWMMFSAMQRLMED